VIKQILYDAARKTLSQKSRLMLKMYSDKYVERTLRKLNGKLLGKVSLEQLQDIVIESVPENIKCLTIHSALSPFKYIYSGKFSDLFNIFDKLLDRGVTLLFPTFPRVMISWDEYFEKNPVFDVKKSPSGMGVMAEYMRMRPDAYRSLHPTKSVACIGPLAEELVSEHHLEETVRHAVSPFAKMLKYSSGVLGMGVEYYRSISHIHVVEEIMGDDFPVILKGDKKTEITLIDSENHKNNFKVTHPHPASYPCQATLIRKYNMDGGLKTWSYRTIPFWYVNANRMVKEMQNAASQGLTVYGDVNDAGFPAVLKRNNC